MNQGLTFVSTCKSQTLLKLLHLLWITQWQELNLISGCHVNHCENRFCDSRRKWGPAKSFKGINCPLKRHVGSATFTATFNLLHISDLFWNDKRLKSFIERALGKLQIVLRELIKSNKCKNIAYFLQLKLPFRFIFGDTFKPSNLPVWLHWNMYP